MSDGSTGGVPEWVGRSLSWTRRIRQMSEATGAGMAGVSVGRLRKTETGEETLSANEMMQYFIAVAEAEGEDLWSVSTTFLLRFCQWQSGEFWNHERK